MSFVGAGALDNGRTIVRRLLGSKVVGQTTVYTVASALATGLSGVSKAIFARAMTASAFGSFSFALSFVGLIAGLFDFGVFASASRRLARSDSRERPALVGATLVAFVPLATLTAITTLGLSFVVDQPFHVHAGSALRIGAVFAWSWTFVLMGELLAKGADRLHVFSISNLVGRVLLLAALASFVALGARLSVTFAYVMASASMAVATVLLAAWLRPSFRTIGRHISAFIADARAWAFQAYVGRFLSVGTYNMDVLMVAWFSTARSTGYYALACAIASVMGLPLLGLSAALFPNMAREQAIERRWVVVAWLIAAFGLLVVVVIVPPLIPLVFSQGYRPVAALAVPLVIATGVRGVTTVYDTFLSAHACGRELRNTSIVLTVSNLAFNFALIPPFGATGAAWASLLALVANYAGYLFYYRRYIASPRAAAAAG